MRRISSKGLQSEHYTGSSIKLPDSRRKLSVPVTAQGVPDERVKPRISLRFASSYYFMGYICWGIVLARLFDFHWLSIVLMVLLVMFVSIIYHVDTPPKTSKKDWWRMMSPSPMMDFGSVASHSEFSWHWILYRSLAMYTSGGLLSTGRVFIWSEFTLWLIV